MNMELIGKGLKKNKLSEKKIALIYFVENLEIKQSYCLGICFVLTKRDLTDIFQIPFLVDILTFWWTNFFNFLDLR